MMGNGSRQANYSRKNRPNECYRRLQDMRESDKVTTPGRVVYASSLSGEGARCLVALALCQTQDFGCHSHACVGMLIEISGMPTQAWAWHPTATHKFD